MKKSIAVAALALSSCSYIPAPQPAPVAGDLPAKVRVLQLDQSAREQLGASEKRDLIIRVGEDGTITLLGAPGHGFSVEKSKDYMSGDKASQNIENKPAEEGVVSRFTVTMTRNSPGCGQMDMNGQIINYPVPDCPHPNMPQ